MELFFPRRFFLLHVALYVQGTEYVVAAVGVSGSGLVQRDGTTAMFDTGAKPPFIFLRLQLRCPHNTPR